MPQSLGISRNFTNRISQILSAKYFISICFVFYLAPRIAVLFVRPLNQSSDFLWYYGRAIEITLGAGYAQGGVPTAFWPAGWPGVLAGVFIVAGSSALAGQIANLVFTVFVFILTALLGKALFRDRLIGRAAVLLLTFYPNQIAYVPLLSTEVFYEMLLLASVWLLMQERFVPALMAGLLFGGATLTKAQSLLLPAFMLLGVFLVAPSRRQLVRLSKLACAVYVMMAIVIAPWTYRNYTVFNAFILVSTNGGRSFLCGNNPAAKGDGSQCTSLADGITYDPRDQVAMDKIARDRAMGWIEANPLQFLALIPRKLVWLWLPDGEAEWFYQAGFARYDANALIFRAVRVLNQGYYFLLLLLALPSVWLVARGRARAFPWASVGLSLCVYFSAISVVFSGQSRYHFVIMPFIAMYAGWTVVRLSNEKAPEERLLRS